MSGGSTRTFLVERYVPLLDEAGAHALASRMEAAVAGVRARGVAVEWLFSLALLREETSLCVFGAADIEHVIRANRDAELGYETIEEVVVLAPGEL